VARWALAAQPAVPRWVAAPARLAEQAQVLLAAADVQRELAVPGAPGAGAARHQRAGAPARPAAADIAAEVAQASRSIEQERSRLAALMSRADAERGGVQPGRPGAALQQPRALQFRALSSAPALAGAAPS
jgi:DNA polymerase-3 subunit epsilon